MLRGLPAALLGPQSSSQHTGGIDAKCDENWQAAAAGAYGLCLPAVLLLLLDCCPLSAVDRSACCSLRSAPLCCWHAAAAAALLLLLSLLVLSLSLLSPSTDSTLSAGNTSCCALPAFLRPAALLTRSAGCFDCVSALSALLSYSHAHISRRRRHCSTSSCAAAQTPHARALDTGPPPASPAGPPTRRATTHGSARLRRSGGLFCVRLAARPGAPRANI